MWIVLNSPRYPSVPWIHQNLILNSGTFLASTMSWHEFYWLIMWWDTGSSVCLETGIFWLHFISSRFWAERNSYVLLTLFRPFLVLLFSSTYFLFANKTLNLFYCSSSCNHSLSLIILVAFTCVFYRTSVSVIRWTHNYKHCWRCGYAMYLYNRKRIFCILDSFFSNF